VIVVRPTELTTANAFVALHHRHHFPAVGHRFSLAAWEDDARLCGVAIIGRPVARLGGDPLDVLEVTRLCTDGTPNACSALYGAAARVGREMGFHRIQTYTLAIEPGVSLRGAGWTDEGERGGGQWSHTDGKPRRTDQPNEIKRRWSRVLRPLHGVPPHERVMPEAEDTRQGVLFGAKANVPREEKKT